MTVNHDVAGSNPASGASGLFVKWLRHRPFTAGSGVRIPHRSPMWAISSAGRASALQAECQQFDPVIAHHKKTSRCEVFFIFRKRKFHKNRKAFISRFLLNQEIKAFFIELSCPPSGAALNPAKSRSPYLCPLPLHGFLRYSEKEPVGLSGSFSE